ncbi:MAG: metallophosphatase [Paludibacteraceae bacterium]|nr:metallophosphatase [Paludibacteraceae bacterium]
MKRFLYIFFLACLFFGCAARRDNATIVILSTTDTHSQVEPLAADAPRNADMGGYARRLGLIENEREKCPNLFLFDSGDFSQGTPYFNFFRGRVEIDAMNRMGYDAATLGNHEFDNGLDTLAMLLRLARFPFVCANYDVSGTPLEGLVKPYVVIERGGVRVGVFGLGVAPDDLISAKNFGGIRYLEPLDCINRTAALLHEKEKCDLVVCLSHLGSTGEGVKGHEDERDMTLIPHTRGVDVFLAGHSHQVLNERLTNADGKEVVLLQSGKSGVFVGKSVIELKKQAQ